MTGKKYFVYLGCPGFPYGLAEIKKIVLISKSLVSAGHSVTVSCEMGIHNRAKYPDLRAFGNFEGIDYVYTSGSPFRNDNIIKRNLLKIKGIINEFLFLNKLRKNKKLDYTILSTNSFYAVLYYVILSKLFGFKTILNYVEYYSGAEFKWSRARKWLDEKLYDKYAPVLADMFFPISEFLIGILKKISPQKKYLKIPVLAEFEKYNDTEILDEPKYFLFSGAAHYLEIVMFIIDSFNRLNNSRAHLYLAIKGNEADLVQIRNYIDKNPQKEKIKLFSTLTDIQLYNYYKNATALLIPLRFTLQDKARFPQKIAEYLASGNPVISTDFGEVKYNFKDMQTMLIASAYDVNLFADKMQFVIDNPAEAQEIGGNGKNMALKNFDYKIYGEKITNFLNEAK